MIMVLRKPKQYSYYYVDTNDIPFVLSFDVFVKQSIDNNINKLFIYTSDKSHINISIHKRFNQFTNR